MEYAICIYVLLYCLCVSFVMSDINGCSAKLRDEFANNQSALGPFLDDYSGFWLLSLANGKLEIQNSGQCKWKFIAPFLILIIFQIFRVFQTPGCPSRPKWEPVLPANLKIQNGMEEQIVRVGFVGENNDENRGDAEWLKNRDGILVFSFLLNSSK